MIAQYITRDNITDENSQGANQYLHIVACINGDYYQRKTDDATNSERLKLNKAARYIGAYTIKQDIKRKAILPAYFSKNKPHYKKAKCNSCPQVCIGFVYKGSYPFIFRITIHK